MDLQSIIVVVGLAICSLLLIVSNWSTVSKWLPSNPLKAIGKGTPSNDPSELIAAYNVARDAAGDNSELAAKVNEAFKALICQKVLLCEK